MNRLTVTRRATPYLVAMLAIGGLLLLTPSLVRAASGGAPPSGGTGTSGQGPSGTGSGALQAGGTVSASGNGMTVTTHVSAILRKPLRVSGNVGSGAAGETVEIERRGRETHWSWAPTMHSTVSSDGGFSATWATNHIGRFSMRAVLETGSTARASTASPTVTVTVYRPSLATIYGPGFWGHRTACGKVLRRSTLGVANRTLKCGTPVAIYWGGRSIIVPVIDRGPYAFNAEWDLTEATAHALGIKGTETIGAVSRPGPALP